MVHKIKGKVRFYSRDYWNMWEKGNRVDTEKETWWNDEIFIADSGVDCWLRIWVRFWAWAGEGKNQTWVGDVSGETKDWGYSGVLWDYEVESR